MSANPNVHTFGDDKTGDDAGAVPRNQALIYGRIERSSKTDKGTVVTEILTPGDGGEFSRPQTIVVLSQAPLGAVGQVTEVVVSLGGKIVPRQYDGREIRNFTAYLRAVV